MSQLNINVGASLDSGTGDKLRDAMIKVNTNFTELFATTDALTGKLSVESGKLVVTGDLVPAADLTYNLGSADKRWHSLFIGANTIYIGDNTVMSGTSIAIQGDPGASSLSQMPTFSASRIIAKPFRYTSSGTNVTVRPSIEFQATDGTAYPISFNTSTNEFSLDAAGDHGTGSLVAKKITLTNTGSDALVLTGNVMQTGNLRIDGNATLGYDTGNTLTVKATATFEGGVTLGNGNDTVAINAGVTNPFTVTASNLTLTSTGAVLPGDLVVHGNLTIQGTTTAIDSNQVNIGDNVLTLNADVPVSMDPTENGGLQIARGTQGSAWWLWDETNDFWSPMGGNLGNINALSVGTLNATSINGTASTASKLATARTIALTGDVTGSASFDGSGNISISTVAGTVGAATTATTAGKLATARTISLSGDATGSVSFDGSSNVSLATSISFPVESVAGKTGAVTLAVADVSGLQTALDDKASSGHTHTSSDITTALGFTPANKAGDTFTGGITVNGNSTFTANVSVDQLILSDVAGQDRDILFASSGSNRWSLRADSAAETGSNAGSNFRIINRDDTGTALGTALFIRRDDGKVGLGTTSPDSRLHVSYAGTSTLKVQNTANAVSFVAEAAASTTRIGSYTNHPLALFTNNTNALTLDTSGNATFAGNATVSGTLSVTGGITGTGFTESVDDRVAAMLVAGSNVTLTYDDTAGTLTIAAAGGGTGGSITGTDVTTALGYTPANKAGDTFTGNVAMTAASAIFTATSTTADSTIKAVGSSGNATISIYTGSNAGTLHSNKQLEFRPSGGLAGIWTTGSLTLRDSAAFRLVINSYTTPTTANASYGSLEFTTSSSTVVGKYWGSHNTTTGFPDLVFGVGSNGATEVLRLDSAGNIRFKATTSNTLTANGQIGFEVVSDTQIKIKYRGSDGVTRSTTLTLA